LQLFTDNKAVRYQ